jgi:hypothetical protein
MTSFSLRPKEFAIIEKLLMDVFEERAEDLYQVKRKSISQENGATGEGKSIDADRTGKKGKFSKFREGTIDAKCTISGSEGGEETNGDIEETTSEILYICGECGSGVTPFSNSLEHRRRALFKREDENGEYCATCQRFVNSAATSL